MSGFVVDPETTIPFWRRLFLALSISQFEIFADTLEFPIEFSDELKAIAKEFALLTLSYMGIITPEAPPLISINPPTETSDQYAQLWDYTFSRLASQGYADSLYRWVKNFANKRSQFADRLDEPPKFDVLLTYWARESKELKFAPLALPQSTIDAIQLIILRHHITYQELYILVTKLERWTTNDDWEDFVIRNEGIGSWLLNEAFFHLQLSKWKQLFAILSEEEISILNQWEYNHMKSQYPEGHFSSIVDLAKALFDS